MYNYSESKDKFDHLFNILNIQCDKTYINCIIIKSVLNIEQDIEDINVLDEELFMSKEENGVYN